MDAEASDKGKSLQLRSSSKLMDVDSSDEEKGSGSRAPGIGNSASEDGEIDEHEDGSAEAGETSTTGERAQMEAVISADLAAGGQEVAQKDARYFMLADVVCSHCGVKGHLSFDCPEEEQKVKCFLCGKAGHRSRECPDEMCYYCKKSGHRARDCPERTAGTRGVRRKRELRSVSPPRKPKLHCYVCGGDGHLDCGLLNIPPGILSCYNCGMTGHAGGGCHMTSVDRVVPIVMEMERERKQRRLTKGPRGSKKSGKGGDDKGGDSDKGGKGEDRGSTPKETPTSYREQILERARKSRYGRGNR